MITVWTCFCLNSISLSNTHTQTQTNTRTKEKKMMPWRQPMMMQLLQETRTNQSMSMKRVSSMNGGRRGKMWFEEKRSRALNLLSEVCVCGVKWRVWRGVWVVKIEMNYLTVKPMMRPKTMMSVTLTQMIINIFFYREKSIYKINQQNQNHNNNNNDNNKLRRKFGKRKQKEKQVLSTAKSRSFKLVL